LTADETARLITTCVDANSVYADIVIVAVTTGMRQGEVLGLAWKDLALEATDASLDVHNNLTRSHDGGWEIGETKTKQSRRHIELAPDAVAALRRQKVRHLEAKLRAGNAWRTTSLVFTNELGQHLLPWNVTAAFHRLTKVAGVRDCRFHDLRHTAATLWLQAGVPLKVVSEALGHASIAVTADVYAKVSPVQRRGLADVMAAITAGTGS
jgi:integrase